MKRNKLCIELIDEQMVAVLRNKTEAERLAIAHGMWRSAREMIIHIVRDSHPDWTLRQAQAEIAKRLSHGTV